MFKRNRKWYTYSECLAWYEYDKAKATRAWVSS